MLTGIERSLFILKFPTGINQTFSSKTDMFPRKKFLFCQNTGFLQENFPCESCQQAGSEIQPARRGQHSHPTLSPLLPSLDVTEKLHPMSTCNVAFKLDANPQQAVKGETFKCRDKWHALAAAFPSPPAHSDPFLITGRCCCT